MIVIYLPADLTTHNYTQRPSHALKQWIKGDIVRDYVDLTQDGVTVFVDFLEHMIVLKPSGHLVVTDLPDKANLEKRIPWPHKPFDIEDRFLGSRTSFSLTARKSIVKPWFSFSTVAFDIQKTSEYCCRLYDSSACWQGKLSFP
jgi:hypothetical protein